MAAREESPLSRDVNKALNEGKSACQNRSCTVNNREIKIHVYGTRQTANVSWEFLKIENKQIKTVQNDSFG